MDAGRDKATAGGGGEHRLWAHGLQHDGEYYERERELVSADEREM
jgi:hypothetical protein